MFTPLQLRQLDSSYFIILCRDEYDVTLISKCTMHVWNLHCSGDMSEQSLTIFHKHHSGLPYHVHGKARSLGQAIRQIKSHDRWQLAGRPKRA